MNNRRRRKRDSDDDDDTDGKGSSGSGSGSAVSAAAPMKDDKEDEQQPSQKKPKTLEEEAQARLANVYASSAFAYEKQREDLALTVLATRTVPTERELIQLLDYATDGMIYVKDLLIIAAGYNEGFDRVLLYDEWRYVLPMKWNVADGDDMRV